LNVLIIGSGGREQAIANAFSRSKKTDRIIVAPGNAGIARHYSTITLPGFGDILSYCEQEQIGLVFIGPEIPIEAGLADYLRSCSIPVVGPSAKAARIETSKSFAKDLMQKYNIPTARGWIADNFETAVSIIDKSHFPIVLKADGLAAGKGVFIAGDRVEARRFLQDTMINGCFGSAGNSVLIEEFLEGWEVSLFVFCDGENFRTTLFSQDHKQLHDNDMGPNTGGMGAFAPVPNAEAYREEIEQKIIKPVLAALKSEGCPYQGVLYCGLMITAEGAKVIEFNCRFGDPETQALLPLLNSDFLDVCLHITQNKVDKLRLEWIEDSSVAVVLASDGYPGTYKKGLPIQIEPSIEDSVIYAGVDSGKEHGAMSLELITAGGRVLNILGRGKDLQQARSDAYSKVVLGQFDGMTFRKDIGLRKNEIPEPIRDL